MKQLRLAVLLSAIPAGSVVHAGQVKLRVTRFRAVTRGTSAARAFCPCPSWGRGWCARATG